MLVMGASSPIGCRPRCRGGATLLLMLVAMAGGQQIAFGQVANCRTCWGCSDAEESGENYIKKWNKKEEI